MNNFYKLEPVFKAVSEKEYKKFIDEYPRRLERGWSGISSPPLISWNDWELANRFPFSVVAETYQYTDKKGDMWYKAPEDREFLIMENYKEVFNSKTGYVAKNNE